MGVKPPWPSITDEWVSLVLGLPKTIEGSWQEQKALKSRMRRLAIAEEVRTPDRRGLLSIWLRESLTHPSDFSLMLRYSDHDSELRPDMNLLRLNGGHKNPHDRIRPLEPHIHRCSAMYVNSTRDPEFDAVLAEYDSPSAAMWTLQELANIQSNTLFAMLPK